MSLFGDPERMAEFVGGCTVAWPCKIEANWDAQKAYIVAFGQKQRIARMPQFHKGSTPEARKQKLELFASQAVKNLKDLYLLVG